MNLSQITAFRAVMTSASISEAARKLGRTQPAVSLAIRSLEESLGIRLFERHGRQLVPVPEAHYLHAEAAEILERLSTITRTMRSLAGGHSGSLSVSAMPGPAAFVFPRFVAEELGDLSAVKISLTSRSSEQIEELARSQSIDFGFCDAPRAPAEDAQYHLDLISAECFLAMPAGHPLSSAERVSIAALDGVAMGSLQPGHRHQRRTLEAFENARVRFHGVIESQTFMPLMQFVRLGQCLALVDPLSVVNENHLASAGGDVAFRMLEGGPRYDYAVLSPIYRPLSQVATRVRAAWQTRVFALLDEVGAAPRWDRKSPSFDAHQDPGVPS
ncbi:MAG: LysR family transcriptional regulator [Pseudomonadota bacterium]